MTTAARIKKPYTYDEFCALVRDGEKADLIDGVIYMASPDNTVSGRLNGWLYRLLGDFVDDFDRGEVFMARIACRLNRFNAPEPDIFYVPKKWRRRIMFGGFKGAPKLAVEIVSPESEDRDYNKKRLQYEHFSIEEYWIIDPMKHKATFLRLGKDRKYREVHPRLGIYRSKVLRGFWLRLEWLWPETRPLKERALAEIRRTVNKS
jgi:Uma2 family endonuclease